MKYPHFLRTTLALLICLGFTAESAQATQYCPSRNPPTAYINPGASANLRGPVHPAAVGVLSCIVKGLKDAGLPIRTLWGYGCRPLSFSNHPRGLAVDVDQYARDKTNPGVPRAKGIQIARACNGVSGAVWRNPDNGHFEVRSLSRAQQKPRRRR